MNNFEDGNNSSENDPGLNGSPSSLKDTVNNIEKKISQAIENVAENFAENAAELKDSQVAPIKSLPHLLILWLIMMKSKHF